MTLKQISSLGRKLTLFLGMFADCFKSTKGRRLLRIYVQGQLSDVHRKCVEAMALRFDTKPRTLQRFLQSIQWDGEKLRDRCQILVAEQHAHPSAIGCIDESGTAKSGNHTVGVQRQYNGNRGKVENCVVGVHLTYASPGFQVLLDSAIYLPECWANDPARRKKTTCPTRLSFVPNHRSDWSKSSTHCPTVFVSSRGRSMNSMVATADF